MASRFTTREPASTELVNIMHDRYYYNMGKIEAVSDDEYSQIVTALDDNLSFRGALVIIIKRFIPSSLSLFVEYSILFSSILFIGALGDPVLISGAGLGVVTINLVVFWVDVGLCGGLDTLVSQAYGRKDFYSCGVYLNSARIIVALLFIPQSLLILYSRSIFEFIGQPEESAIQASYYSV